MPLTCPRTLYLTIPRRRAAFTVASLAPASLTGAEAASCLPPAQPDWQGANSTDPELACWMPGFKDASYLLGAWPPPATMPVCVNGQGCGEPGGNGRLQACMTDHLTSLAALHAVLGHRASFRPFSGRNDAMYRSAWDSGGRCAGFASIADYLSFALEVGAPGLACIPATATVLLLQGQPGNHNACTLVESWLSPAHWLRPCSHIQIAGSPGI